MKSLNGVIKTLIWINILTAISALAIFILVRERQAVTANRSLPPESVTVESGNISRLSPEESGEKYGGTDRPPRLQQKVENLERELARTRETVKALQSRSRQSLPELPVNARPAIVSHQIVPAVIAITPIAPDDRPSPPSRASRPEIPVVLEKIDAVEVSASPNVLDSTRNEDREPIEIAMQPAGPLPPRLPADVAPNRVVAATPNRESEATKEPAPLSASPKPRESFGRNPVALSNRKKVRSIRYANDIAYGLVVADNKGQINYGTTHYRRVQTAIFLLRQGENIETAARRSSVPVATLQQLIKWGENRPGNLAALVEVGEPASRWQ